MWPAATLGLLSPFASRLNENAALSRGVLISASVCVYFAAALTFAAFARRDL